MPTDEIRTYLEKSRAQLADIDRRLAHLAHDRDVAAARVEAFEIAAGDGPTYKSHGEDAAGSRLPIPHAPRTAAPAQRSRGQGAIPRAPQGAWKKVFGALVAKGIEQFNYDDVVKAALEQGIDAHKPSARVRVSKFKDGGYLESVRDGLFRVTPRGEGFFK
jgi:hypothetical protein